jgi:hypothetical protein
MPQAAPIARVGHRGQMRSQAADLLEHSHRRGAPGAVEFGQQRAQFVKTVETA